MRMVGEEEARINGKAKKDCIVDAVGARLGMGPRDNQ